MSTILFIVTESESANGICARAVMKELTARGHRVLCITNREYGQRKDYALGGIQYYAVKPRLVYRISSYLSRSGVKGLRRRLIAGANLLLNKARLLASIRTWPVISPLYTDRLYSTALDVCRASPVCCVIPIYTQIDAVIAAHRLKSMVPGILYIPYFLDSLSGGYGPRCFSPARTLKRCLNLERRLLANADRIIAMKSSRTHHALHSAGERYYDRLVFLDLPLLTERSGTRPAAVREGGGSIKILYVGSLPAGIRSPEYFLEVFSRITSGAYALIFVGTCDCAVLNGWAARDGRIRVIGRCAHEEAERYEDEADVFLNLGNTNTRMTPSKIFEYMSWGKPIISTAPIDDEPSIPYLRRYGHALILHEDYTTLQEAADRVAAFTASDQGVTAATGTLGRIFRDNTPQAFADAVENEINNSICRQS